LSRFGWGRRRWSDGDWQQRNEKQKQKQEQEQKPKQEQKQKQGKRSTSEAATIRAEKTKEQGPEAEKRAPP
jgi:hypothetical protein